MSFTKGVSLLGWMVLGAYVIYLRFFEPAWLTYANNPLPVTNSPVKVGAAPMVYFRRCNTDNQTHIYDALHSLINDDMRNQAEVGMPTIQSPAPAGCTTMTRAISGTIPEGTPPGHYHISGDAEVHMTLRTVFVHWESKSFEVVAK